MKFHEQVLQKSKNRLYWEVYMLRTQLHRKMWDFLVADNLNADLTDACVFDDHLQPYLSDNDAIFTDPTIAKDGLRHRHAYLYHLRKPVFIEPQFGYAIVEPHSIIDLALPESEIVRKKEAMQFFSGLPSLRKLSAAQKGKSPVRKYKLVVSLRFVFDSNYYHFFCDVMSRIKAIDDYGVNKSVPLVISPQLLQVRGVKTGVDRITHENRP